MDLISIFVTGLFAGGLTCLAVQGGLLASSIAHQEEDKLKKQAVHANHFVPVASFLLARLVAYTVVGLLLGSLGSAVELSLQLRVALQIAVAIFMIGTALNLLEIHPMFRYFVIQPPKFLTRLVRNQSKSKNVFGPALLGGFTIFIPCGATQAMMAYAVSTASPVGGAITMFLFILGTSPLFFILGYIMKRLSGSISIYFNKLAAAAIFLIALVNLNGALSLAGSNYSLDALLFSKPTTQTASTAVQEGTIFFGPLGYVTEPKNITVRAGSKVRLNLVNKDGTGCIQAFVIPKLGIQRVVPVGTSDSIEFTAPNEVGPMVVTCSMGMYRDYIYVN